MRHIYLSVALSGLAAFTLASAAHAREELSLEQGEDWVHPHSEIAVPATLGGLERRGATAFATDALNTGINFGHGDDLLSVYVWRKTNGSVPVWFEQARLGIETRDAYKGARLAGTSSAFALPGRETVSGLRAAYDLPEGSSFSSTGLALFSLGEWFIKLRASSATRDATALDAWMMQAVGEMTLPTNLSPGPSVLPVKECAEPLTFKKKAKDAPRDGAVSLLGGLLGQIAAQKATEAHAENDAEPVVWCRDATLGDGQTMYRPDASTDRYLLAIGDSGSGVWVGLDQAAQLMAGAKGGAKPQYSITLHLDDSNVNFVPQNRLPSPERVVELIDKRRITTSVSTWGDDKAIRIQDDAM